jgi:hypothetical protein
VHLSRGEPWHHTSDLKTVSTAPSPDPWRTTVRVAAGSNLADTLNALVMVIVQMLPVT